MKHSKWLLIERLDGWQVCKRGKDGSTWTGRATTVEHLMTELNTLGYQGEPLVVGLHLNRCVSGVFEAGENARSRQNEELLYDFEQVVPFSAEDLTAAFTVGSDAVFGVGVPVAELKPFLEELQDSGVNIESVSPSTLLAVQAGIIEDSQFVILASDCLELVHITADGVFQWHKLPEVAQQAIQKLKLVGFSPEDSLLIIGDGENVDSLVNATDLTANLIRHEQSYDDLVIESAEKIAAGEMKNLFEQNQPRLLSTDKLRRLRPAIHFAFAAFGLGLLLVMASFAWQIKSYSELRTNYRKDQEKAYVKIHTGAIPQSIKLRLTSEWKKIKQQAELAKFSNASQGGKAVTTLHRLLASLANVSRSTSPDAPCHFRVTSMNFGGSGQASLYINFKNRSDAEKVRQQLISEGFEVKAFPTRMRDGRVVVDAIIQLKLDQTKPT